MLNTERSMNERAATRTGDYGFIPTRLKRIAIVESTIPIPPMNSTESALKDSAANME